MLAQQYGDVFTFLLFGRRIAVALGPKGNNFVLGGKSTVLNAEDAYTVHFSQRVCPTNRLTPLLVTAFDHPRLR
jgi:hypothetical protein